MEDDEKNVLNVTTKSLVELLCSFVEKNCLIVGGVKIKGQNSWHCLCNVSFAD